MEKNDSSFVTTNTGTDGDAANTILDDSAMKSHKRRKPRHRNRRLYAELLRQMEFYMSDANLHKDKYLKRNMSHCGWIELDLFVNFNKIKSLTGDKRVLIRALSKSTVFEISEDGKSVRRKKAYVPPNQEEVDDRTIYVEPIPLDADHSYVKNIMKPVGGRILYVSLPRYKRSRQLKGFAFVEFDSAEACEKACKTFSPNSPEIGKFPNSNKQLESLKRKCSNDKNKKETEKLESQESSSKPQDIAVAPAPQNPKILAISKKKWLELKNAYLSLQKERVKALKQVVEGKFPLMSDNEVTKEVENNRKRKVSDSRSDKPKHIKFDDEEEDD